MVVKGTNSSFKLIRWFCILPLFCEKCVRFTNRLLSQQASASLWIYCLATCCCMLKWRHSTVRWTSTYLWTNKVNLWCMSVFDNQLCRGSLESWIDWWKGVVVWPSSRRNIGWVTWKDVNHVRIFQKPFWFWPWRVPSCSEQNSESWIKRCHSLSITAWSKHFAKSTSNCHPSQNEPSSTIIWISDFNPKCGKGCLDRCPLLIWEGSKGYWCARSER